MYAADGGLTVSGFEFAVLYKNGLGVDATTGEVRKLTELTPESWWEDVYLFAKENKQWEDRPLNALNDIDESLRETLQNSNVELFREPRPGQTFFFGFE